MKHWFKMTQEGVQKLLDDLDCTEKRRSAEISNLASAVDRKTWSPVQQENYAGKYNVMLTSSQLRRLRQRTETQAFNEKYGVITWARSV